MSAAGRDAPRSGRHGRPGALRPGAVLGGHTLERLLGEGASGSVFVARPAVGAPRALKVVGAHGRPDRLERFAREGRTLARLPRHPGVVVVHDGGVEGDLAWCALELVEGADLERALAAGPLLPRRAARIGRDLANALAHLHAHGVVHRDLKPANVLLRAADDAPVIVDFGIARDEVEARMTASQAVLGTPAYMAPEQLEGGRAVGPASDVFALGAVLYELLTGAPAFTGETLFELSARVATTAVPPPSAARPDVPRDLDRVVLACLRKEPGERPSAARVEAALAALDRGEGLARDALGGEARPSWRPGLRPLAALGAAAALALGVVALRALDRARDRTAARAALERARAVVDLEVGPWLGATAAATAGVGSAPATRPDPGGEVGRALEAGRPALEEPLAAEAEGLGPWLEAPLALARVREADGELPAGATPAAAAVEALVALERGDRRQALARAERAGRGGPAGAHVRQAVRALLEPERLLGEAERAGPAALDVATRAALPAAFAGQTTALVRRAASARALDQGAQELDRLADLARALGADLAPAREAQLASLEEHVAPALEALVEGELRRADADPALTADLIRRVADLARRGPGDGQVGPRVRRALEPLAQGPLDDWRRSSDRTSPAAWRLLGRACAVDTALAYELGRPTPPALVAALAELVSIDVRADSRDQRWASQVLHAALRVGVPCAARDLPPPALPLLQALVDRYPRSRAARAALTYVGQERSWKGGSLERQAAVAQLDEVFAAPHDDLAPTYAAELHLRRGELLATEASSARRRGRPDEARALAARARADLAAAEGVLPVRDLVLNRAEAESTTCSAVEDPEGRRASWARAVELFRARAEGRAPALRSSRVEELRTVARILVERAEAEQRLGQATTAEATLRESIELGRACGWRDGMARARLCDLLAAAGRLDEAQAALEPALDQAEVVWEVAAADVRLRLARGDPEGAREVLRVALTRHRTDELDLLRRELGLEKEEAR